ncbi:hypothetical protein AAFF_G00299170 [Aldrovandia affinis]|uniref:Uncharacterized protein n=1 Tax=Aldrovandia affinis TaxID=143900 RepID=A0AAD7R8I6_9TELE|nr:hypothetical protein AAFF_G00299170 [Aldrovandia affinis]
MLRGERPRDGGGGDGGRKGKPAASKMAVPTILIQDFSDGAGPAGAQGVASGDGLSSKERRRRRREQERREREEEKARKKREKEMEKERDRERKKPQTRGKSFQVHSRAGVPPPGNNASKTPGSNRNSAPYFDTYF